MLGMQWCENCRAPRFEIPVRSIDDVPTVCAKCGESRICARFVGSNFAELRGALAKWILGPDREGNRHPPTPARLTEARQRFDAVIATLERREATCSPAWRTALSEYRAIRHRRGGAEPRCAAPTEESSSSTSTRLGADRLHELIEEARAQECHAGADEGTADSAEEAAPSSALSSNRRRWAMLLRNSTGNL